MFSILIIIIFLAFTIPITYTMIKIMGTQRHPYEFDKEIEIKKLNRKRTRRIILLFISFVIVSFLVFFGNYLITKNKPEVKQEKFDKSRWSAMDGKEYLYRDNMLNDLVYKQKLKGLKKDEVLHLLGEPNRTDTNYFFYIVDQSFLGDVPVPLHTKSLVIKFLNDTVEWRKIKE